MIRILFICICVHECFVCRKIFVTFHGDAADNEPSDRALALASREKKKSAQTPHIEITLCKPSPPNNRVYGVFFFRIRFEMTRLR